MQPNSQELYINHFLFKSLKIKAMKTIVFLIICLILSISAIGQDRTKNVDIDEVRVTPPKFTMVQNASEFFNSSNYSPIENYLIKHFVCPTEVAECNIEGTEVIQFTVTPDGKLTNFEVVNSVCREVDKELIKILNRTDEMWLPGYNNGEPTAMEHEVSLMIGDYSQNEIVNHFIKKAENNFEKGGSTLFVDHKPKKALRHYNNGIRYMPNDKSLLLMRGICHYELGNKERARRDWNRVVTLGGIDYDMIEPAFVNMKGYKEMTKLLANKTK